MVTFDEIWFDTQKRYYVTISMDNGDKFVYPDAAIDRTGDNAITIITLVRGNVCCTTFMMNHIIYFKMLVEGDEDE